MRLLTLMLFVTLAAAEDVASLRRALMSDEPGARWRAAWSLSRLGEQAKPAVPDLARALGDKDRATRFAAEIALARIGAADAAARIVADAEQTSHARQGAAGVLTRLGSAAAVPQLTAALKIADTKLRLRAVEALAAIGKPAAPAVPQLVKLLGKESLHDALGAAFAAIGAPALEPLAKAVGKGSTKSRTGAAKALGHLGKPAVPALIPALKDKKDDVAMAACKALARIGEDAAAAESALVELEVRDSWPTDDEAARTLRAIRGAMPAAESLRRIKDALAHEKDPGMLKNAAYALADGGPTKDAVPALMQMLKLEDGNVLMAACHALGTIGRDAAAARDEICRVLMKFRNADKMSAALDRHIKTARRLWPGFDQKSRKARDDYVKAQMSREPIGFWPAPVRVVAIWALARLRDPGGEVLACLAGASRSKEPIERDFALAARWVLGERVDGAAQGLAKRLDYRDFVYHANYAHDLILVLGPAARELIPALVKHELWHSRAMIAMGALAVPTLRKELRKTAAREYVLRTLTAMGPEAEDAAPDLVLLCKSERVAPAAERALAAIGLSAVPALIAGLEHRAPAVRRSCARVLGLLKAENAIPALKRLAVADPNVWVRYEADLAVRS